MRPFAIFAFSSILCITLIALPINAELVCPIDIPLSTCAACQAAIDSIFSPNYFNGNIPPPDKFHPCDFYSRTEWEVIRRWRPGTSPFDATVPQLLKDAFDAACSNSSTCTEQEAIDGSKIIETGCGELVEASNDAGIVNATTAYIILRNIFPEKNVYCNKDANGDNYGWQILRDVINYAATIVPRGIAGLIVPPNPALVFVTFDNTTGSPSVYGIPDSVICSNAYKYMPNYSFKTIVTFYRKM
ncbi:7169_t:CDS:2 [Paraglomus occultum]|uniref:7169_t:CDS:1 n=1 Tax=Paraglomus occultum TaxID=144539 RepID=A0A9N9AD40_9GLOM|nr:7169_t:CDS:2 [Paraglomus occultum]